jgi:two-component system CheB/CheR fusion protein
MDTLSDDERGRLLHLLLEQSTEHALVLLDPDGAIVGWLAGAETVFGYRAQEVVGRRHNLLFTPEDNAEGVPKGEMEIAKRGAPAEDDRWMMRKDGVRFWATGVLQAVWDDGRLIGFGKWLRNRTDLRGLMESQRKEVERLELEHQRRDNFVSILAHELRAPLQSLVVATDLLEPSVKDSDDGAFAVSILRRQFHAMERMFDDLVDVARVRAGKLQLELKETPLANVLQAAIAACQPLIEEHGVQFDMIYASEPVSVRADAMRLEQVFVNLVSNAAKYTPRGGRIWMKFFVEGRDAVVKVEDTGIGISPALLPRVFELFTQAESTSGDRRAGLGIGLSVVKELVDLHRGTIVVRSDGVGKGSEFTVRLPLAGKDENRPDDAG